MKGFALDLVLVALLMLAGFAATGNLDGVMDAGFCLLFAAIFATLRGVARRRKGWSGSNGTGLGTPPPRP